MAAQQMLSQVRSCEAAAAPALGRPKHVTQAPASSMSPFLRNRYGDDSAVEQRLGQRQQVPGASCLQP